MLAMEQNPEDSAVVLTQGCLLRITVSESVIKALCLHCKHRKYLKGQKPQIKCRFLFSSEGFELNPIAFEVLDIIPIAIDSSSSRPLSETEAY